MTGPLGPDPDSFNVEIAIEKLRRYKSSHISQLLVDFIETGGKTLC